MTNIENPFAKKKEEEVVSEIPEEITKPVDTPSVEKKKPLLLKRDRNRPPAEDMPSIPEKSLQKDIARKQKIDIPVFKHTPIADIPESVEKVIPKLNEDSVLLLSDHDENHNEEDDLSDYNSLLEGNTKSSQQYVEKKSQQEDNSLITANFLDEEEEEIISLPKNNAFSIKERQSKIQQPNIQDLESDKTEVTAPTNIKAKPAASKFSNVSKQFGKQEVAAPKNLSDAMKKTQDKVAADAALKELHQQKIAAEQVIVAKMKKRSKLSSIFQKVIVPSFAALAIVVGSGIAYLGYQDVSTANFAQVDAKVTKVLDVDEGLCEITYTYKGKYTQYEGVATQASSCENSVLEEGVFTTAFFREDQESSASLNEPVEGAGWLNVYMGGGIALLGFIIGGTLVISSVRRLNKLKKNEANDVDIQTEHHLVSAE